MVLCPLRESEMEGLEGGNDLWIEVSDDQAQEVDEWGWLQGQSQVAPAASTGRT